MYVQYVASVLLMTDHTHYVVTLINSYMHTPRRVSGVSCPFYHIKCFSIKAIRANKNLSKIVRL